MDFNLQNSVHTLVNYAAALYVNSTVILTTPYIASDGVQDSQEALSYVSPIESLHVLQEPCGTVLLNTSFPAPSGVAYPVQLFVRTPLAYSLWCIGLAATP